MRDAVRSAGRRRRRSMRWVVWGGLVVSGFAVATVNATCVAVGVVTCSATVSALPLPFGNYDPNNGTARDISSSITVTSTAFGLGLATTIGYAISLNQGMNGSVPARKMVGGSAATPLGYNVFTNSNYDQVWGNNSVSDSVSVGATLGGTSVTRNYAVYGRVPPRQYVSVGVYTDTITVTVNY